MHDAKGRPLRPGDRVMIPGVIVSIAACDDYCNASVETHFVMPGNNSKSNFSSINTRQLLRAEPGDDLSLEPAPDSIR